MRVTQTPVQTDVFTQSFDAVLDPAKLAEIWQDEGPKPRGHQPKLSGPQLVQGLTFHALAGPGTLAQHVKPLHGVDITDSALTQRRQAAGFEVFRSIANQALVPLADPLKHPHSFYGPWRLVALDGSQFSVSNTPQTLGRLNKAASRRFEAAFAKLPLSWMIEVGTHAPVAVEIGVEQESEWELSHRILRRVQAGWIIIADRLYGVGRFVNELSIRCQSVDSQWLVRVRENVKSRVCEHLKDGSAIVSVGVSDPKRPSSKQGEILVREIVGFVRQGSKRVPVRLWTSLMDEERYPASELLGLYVQRWEIELATREWKLELRGSELLQSHTVETAAQELLCGMLALAVLARARLEAAEHGEVPPLRISFAKTHWILMGLWEVLQLGRDLLQPRQVEQLVDRAMSHIGSQALPKRRPRSCPRAVRQPIGRWPRVTTRTERNEPVQYEVISSASV